VHAKIAHIGADARLSEFHATDTAPKAAETKIATTGTRAQMCKNPRRICPSTLFVHAGNPL